MGEKSCIMCGGSFGDKDEVAAISFGLIRVSPVDTVNNQFVVNEKDDEYYMHLSCYEELATHVIPWK